MIGFPLAVCFAARGFLFLKRGGSACRRTTRKQADLTSFRRAVFQRKEDFEQEKIRLVKEEREFQSFLGYKKAGRIFRI